MHYRFVSSYPNNENYKIKRLFELFDAIPASYRDQIAPNHFLFHLQSVQPDVGEAKLKINAMDRYQNFKTAFLDYAQRNSSDDEDYSQDFYAVYAVVSYILAKAFSATQREVYGGFRARQSDSLRKFKTELKGDEATRQRAMAWSARSIEHLDEVYFVACREKAAYEAFCETVVAALLSGQDNE